MTNLGKHLIRSTAAVALTVVMGTAPALAAAPGRLMSGDATAMVGTSAQAGHWFNFDLSSLLHGRHASQAAPVEASATGGSFSFLPQGLLSLFGLGGTTTGTATASLPVAQSPLCGPPLIRMPSPGSPVTGGGRGGVIVMPPVVISPGQRRPSQPTVPTYPTVPTTPTYPTVPTTPTVPTQPTTPTTPTAPAAGLSAMEQQMLTLVNNARQQAGLQPLQADAQLMQVARTKAQDMVTNNYFDHNSPTLGSPFDLMHRFGVTYRTAGENIAGNGSVDGAFQSLMNSPGHRANILNPSFTRIGIGIVPGGPYGMMIAQEFAG